MVKVIKIKEDIERKIEGNINEEELGTMNAELATHLKGYESQITGKIELFGDIIGNLK